MNPEQVSRQESDRGSEDQIEKNLQENQEVSVAREVQLADKIVLNETQISNLDKRAMQKILEVGSDFKPKNEREKRETLGAIMEVAGYVADQKQLGVEIDENILHQLKAARTFVGAEKKPRILARYLACLKFAGEEVTLTSQERLILETGIKAYADGERTEGASGLVVNAKILGLELSSDQQPKVRENIKQEVAKLKKQDTMRLVQVMAETASSQEKIALSDEEVIELVRDLKYEIPRMRKPEYWRTLKFSLQAGFNLNQLTDQDMNQASVIEYVAHENGLPIVIKNKLRVPSEMGKIMGLVADVKDILLMLNKEPRSKLAVGDDKTSWIEAIDSRSRDSLETDNFSLSLDKAEQSEKEEQDETARVTRVVQSIRLRENLAENQPLQFGDCVISDEMIKDIAKSEVAGQYLERLSQDNNRFASEWRYKAELRGSEYKFRDPIGFKAGKAFPIPIEDQDKDWAEALVKATRGENPKVVTLQYVLRTDPDPDQPRRFEDPNDSRPVSVNITFEVLSEEAERLLAELDSPDKIRTFFLLGGRPWEIKDAVEPVYGEKEIYRIEINQELREPVSVDNDERSQNSEKLSGWKKFWRRLWGYNKLEK